MSFLLRASSVAAATTIHSLTALLMSVLIARTLGPGGRGLYAIVTLAALLTGAFGSLGLPAGATIRVGRTPATTSGFFTATLILAAAAGFGLVIVVNALAGSNGLALFTGIPRHLVLVGSLAIPLLIASGMLSGILAGLGQVARTAWITTGCVGIQLGLTATVVLLRPGGLGPLVVVFALGAGILAGALATELHKHQKVRLVDPRPAVRGTLLFSLKAHAANCLHLLHLRADVFIVKAFLSAQDVGLYSLAQAVCEWVWLLPRSTATTLMPTVARSSGAGAIDVTARASRLMLFLTAGPLLLLAAVSGWLVPFVFGSAFAPSVAPLRLLLPGIWAGSATGILSAYLTGGGRSGYPLATSAIATAANVALNLVLVPRFGVRGAAVASAITYTLALLVNGLFVCRVAGVGLADLLVVRPADVASLRESIVSHWGRLRST